jgi:membrane protein implicated in regulation of membrane protease activity
MKTNIDAVMGKHGVVYRHITRTEAGFVKVESEEWRASSSEEIGEGEEIEVIGVKGVTLQVRRPKEDKGIIGKLGRLLGRGKK